MVRHSTKAGIKLIWQVHLAEAVYQVTSATCCHWSYHFCWELIRIVKESPTHSVTYEFRSFGCITRLLPTIFDYSCHSCNTWFNLFLSQGNNTMQLTLHIQFLEWFSMFSPLLVHGGRSLPHHVRTFTCETHRQFPQYLGQVLRPHRIEATNA